MSPALAVFVYAAVTDRVMCVPLIFTVCAIAAVVLVALVINPPAHAEHAPYLSKHSANKLCLTCLTSDCGGEFDTVIEWAQHVERILNGGR